MNHNILAFLLCISLFLMTVGFTESHTTSYKLDVFKDGERIGQIDTYNTNVSGTTNYLLQSNVEIEMLLTVKISEAISNKYEKGKLLSASHSRIVNGVSQSKNTVRYENNQYVSANGKPLNNTGTWIGISILALYHKEPVGITAVYSESQACWVTLQKQADGCYKALLPDGKSTTFTYTNGLLTKVVSDTKWGEIVFKRH